MKIFLKTLFIFFVFQIIKIPIFIIQQIWVNNESENVNIETINFGIILSKYLPVIIIIMILILKKSFKQNIISFFIALILEVFILDKYLFLKINNNFTVSMIVNSFIYIGLSLLVYFFMKKYCGTIFDKTNNTLEGKM